MERQNLYNFPLQSSSFIDRTTDLAQLLERFEKPECRLITLTGPGGTGKTRLAIQLASNLRRPFSGGVYFVALQPLNSPEFISTAIANSLNLVLHDRQDPTTQLLNYLRDKQLVLVLDNFEHLLDGVELVSGILDSAPGVKIIATSREVLNLSQEWLWPLNGLGFPVELEIPNPEDYPAVQLFVARARQVLPEFSLVALDNQTSVIRLCQLVEGLPLALELAASWLRVLTSQEIVTELERKLDVLETARRDIPARHRSMRAVFDASWKLLTEQEQFALKRLAVFQGTFGLEAALAVAQSSLKVISSLVDKSLLQRNQQGRYHLHELLRQYTLEQLNQCQTEAREAYRIHSKYYAGLLARHKEAIVGGRQREAIQELAEEIANIRLAWDWLVQELQVREIQQAGYSLSELYHFQSRIKEAVATFEKTAAALESAGLEDSERAYTLAGILGYAGWFYIVQGQTEQSRKVLERGLAIYKELGARPQPGYATNLNAGLATLAIIKGDYLSALCYGEKALQESQENEDYANLALAHKVISGAGLQQGQNEKAYYHAQQSIVISKQLGNDWLTAYCLVELGKAAISLGNYAEAKRCFEESCAIRTSINDRHGRAVTLNQLGMLAMRQGAYNEAIETYRQSLEFQREIGDLNSLALAARGLGTAYQALGNYGEAWKSFLTSLTTSLETGNVPLILSVLKNVAELLLKTGRVAQAVELIVLLLDHPSSNQSTLHRLEELLSRCRSLLSPTEFEAALERGKQTLLEDTAKGLVQQDVPVLTENKVTHSTANNEAVLKPAQTLIEPLSERELEIMRFLANGLSNQEIADKLVLTIGTIKTHNNHIFSKMGVKNRTQAVLYARQLNLI
jgi:predicted ATPase/DNA-binding CsgD family transcriptional regulator